MFTLHAVSCLVALIVQQVVVPETKGKSLEEIRLMLEGPGRPEEKYKTSGGVELTEIKDAKLN